MSPEMTSMHDMRDWESPNHVLLSRGRYIHFGPFQVDQLRQVVTRNGSRIKLQRMVYQVLIALMEKPGEVLTREELRHRLWSAETHVNYEANVNTNVNKLRHLLGDSLDKPQYIETVARKGYRLLVRPEISNTPQATHLLLSQSAEEVKPEPRRNEESVWPRPAIWNAVGIVGLILAGMLIGIVVTRLWISHFALASPFFPYTHG